MRGVAQACCNPASERADMRAWGDCEVSDWPLPVSAKSDRQAAREAVAGYHESQLTALVQHVGDAIDRFRGGELDAFDVDQAISQYARAAKELWKFCSLGDPELVANTMRERPAVDWWERGAPRKR
jgi:hypothetical protein